MANKIITEYSGLLKGVEELRSTGTIFIKEVQKQYDSDLFKLKTEAMDWIKIVFCTIPLSDRQFLDQRLVVRDGGGQLLPLS